MHNEGYLVPEFMADGLFQLLKSIFKCNRFPLQLKREITYELRDVDAVAQELIASGILDHKVITLTGDLGAGKTTLIKAIGKALGVRDHISSPTFSLVNEYAAGDLMVYHIDLYRIKDLEEALHVGIEEYLYGDGLCLIEWPQVIESILPEQFLRIEIENLGKFTRKLHLHVVNEDEGGK